MIIPLKVKVPTGNLTNRINFKTKHVYASKEKVAFFNFMKSRIVPDKKLQEYALTLVDKPLVLKIAYFIPKSVFFTKQGKISIRSIDCDNMAKTACDGLFKYLPLDDKSIVDLYVVKRANDTDGYLLQYELVEKV